MNSLLTDHGPLRQLYRKSRKRVQTYLLPREARKHALVGPPNLWKMKRSFQIAFLTEHAGMQPTDRVLDIGCGTLRGGVPIIDYLNAGHYAGVDVRAQAIAEACRELYTAGLADKQVTLVYAGTIATVTLGPPFDIAWAFSVFMHLDDQSLLDVFGMAARTLAPHGVFYANANVGEDKGPREWNGFPILWRPTRHFRDVAEEFDLQVEDIGSLGSLGHVTGTIQDEQRMLRFSHGAAPQSRE